MPPRAQLMMRTPVFILAKAALLIKPWVSGVSGTWTVIKSDFGKNLFQRTGLDAHARDVFRRR